MTPGHEQATVNPQSESDRRFEAMLSKIGERFDESWLKSEKHFDKIDADLLQLKWMTGVMFAGVASLVVKAFF